jgi:hypothetical protein
VKGREEKCPLCKCPGETKRLKRLGLPWSKKVPSVPTPKLDSPVGWRYIARAPRKGMKISTPMYPVEMKLTRRLLRDCKLDAAMQRLVKEAFVRLRRNHRGLKREKRDPDERKIIGQVIGATLHRFEVRPLVEVPEGYHDPMSRDEGE